MIPPSGQTSGMEPPKVKCEYCGKTIRRNTKPYRDFDGQLYHVSCFREMTDGSYRKRYPGDQPR
jgi:hypothetical protein